MSGAGGFLGRYVVDELCARGHSVRAIIRPTSPDRGWSRKVEIFRADLELHDGLQSAFDDMDAVIHLAAATTGTEEAQLASTVVGTERFLDAMTLSSVKRLVHVSSLVVYDWAKAHDTLDEDTPLLSERDLPYLGAYTVAKARQEKLVSRYAKDHAWDLTITRPGFIWGLQHAEIAGMGRHKGPLYLMFGPSSRLPLTHVVNCANCLVAALESTATVGDTFNVIDGDRVRVWRYVREYARGTGQLGLPVPIPYRFALGVAELASLVNRTLMGGNRRLPSLLTPRRLESQFKPLRFSNQKLHDVLGWTPPLTFEECVKLTYGSAA